MEENITMTVGIDLGDRYGQLCVLSEDGEILEESRIPMTAPAVKRRFESMEKCRIAMETGTHSRWMYELLEEMGHEVIVANARKLQMIYGSDEKCDKIDALKLAKIARFDASLLAEIKPRSREKHEQLNVIRARATAVEVRTKLVNHIRGVCKASGIRLQGCTASAFCGRAKKQILESLRPALEPLFTVLQTINETIRNYDREIERMVEKLSEAKNLATINGVGGLTALAFVLTLDDPHRFSKSRKVGAYLGMRPRRQQSGLSDKQLRITKAGDIYLRCLLVNCAHYVVGPFGKDSALRQWGLQLMKRGGKNAKKRAIVAVARKLSVIMHRMWVTGAVYEPFPTVKAALVDAAVGPR